MFLVLLAACSDYAFEGKTAEPPGGDVLPPEDTDVPVDTDTDTGDPPPEETCNGADDDGDGVIDEAFPDTDADGAADCVDVEDCDGVDNNGDGAVDEGFDANGDGVVDCFAEEEQAYCTPFDDFSGWAYTGEGEWHVESGMLTEGRNGPYAAIAYLYDLGTAERFMIQVDTAWGSNANDFTGIAWGVAGESAYVARWDDPQDYYDRYTPTGAMDVSRCDGSGCTQLAFDASADLYWPEGMSFVTWHVYVDGEYVEVVVNGTLALAATIPEIAGTGPRVVGVYSNDNDGGVWFDNFCVWMDG